MAVRSARRVSRGCRARGRDAALLLQVPAVVSSPSYDLLPLGSPSGVRVGEVHYQEAAGIPPLGGIGEEVP